MSEITGQEITALISHELRTPLTSIKGYVDLLSKGFFDELNDKQKNAVTIIQKEVNKLNFIIENLVSSSSIEHPELKLKIEAVEINTILNDAIEAYKKIQDDSIDIHIENITENYPLVYVDRDKIKQVFIHLFDNSCKFNDKKKKEIRIKISKIKEEDSLRIILKDNGMGIPVTYYNTVVKKFKQIENFLDRRHEGLGLGLYLAETIIQRHNGKFGINSEENEYTKIYFSLPTVDVSSNE